METRRGERESTRRGEGLVDRLGRDMRLLGGDGRLLRSTVSSRIKDLGSRIGRGAIRRIEGTLRTGVRTVRETAGLLRGRSSALADIVGRGVQRLRRDGGDFFECRNLGLCLF